MVAHLSRPFRFVWLVSHIYTTMMIERLHFFPFFVKKYIFFFSGFSISTFSLSTPLYSTSFTSSFSLCITLSLYHIHHQSMIMMINKFNFAFLKLNSFENPNRTNLTNLTNSFITLHHTLTPKDNRLSQSIRIFYFF